MADYPPDRRPIAHVIADNRRLATLAREMFERAMRTSGARKPAKRA